MSESIPLTSNSAPEVLYVNFEEFMEGHQAMVSEYGSAYLGVHMLVRLARDNLEKARRVFIWSVSRVCASMLADGDRRFGLSAQELSPQGLYWATRAEETFGRNPMKAISLIEGIYLLERIAVWAEFNYNYKFPNRSLAEFRRRPESNEEATGKLIWLDVFYQQARAQAIRDAEHFVKRRDCAIGLCITSLAGSRPPSDKEIDEVMTQHFPTHQSLASHAKTDSAPTPVGSLANHNNVINWVLGPHQKEYGF